ncbi:MAG: hypothetical protein WCL34_08295 [Methylococcaceae bacterium]
MSATFKILMPTDEEDAQINAGIALDSDTREFTEADFLQMRPARKVVPDIVSAYKKGRMIEGTITDLYVKKG